MTNDQFFLSDWPMNYIPKPQKPLEKKKERRKIVMDSRTYKWIIYEIRLSKTQLKLFVLYNNK